MTLARRVAVPALSVILAAGCSSSGGSGGGASGAGGSSAASASGERRARTTNSVLDVTGMLSGTWEGSTPGNGLHLVITGTGSPTTGDVSNLSALVSGKYQDRNVREQGVIRLENQGRQVWLAYIPHFDPTAIGLTGALRFSREELESACSFYVAPRGDGYAGETRGTAWCARAIRGAVGKWTFEIEPGSIRIRSVETGETLRFRRTEK